ncbi:alpha,alpha-trehalase [Nematocida displodere]|uniref:Trehalase n=1 Tax=Nematocida displodere TaxID=1805483 RepID=A0A177EHB5_9MICR|nr:alpha,alpha-trehalase [Nematocida displodere]
MQEMQPGKGRRKTVIHEKEDKAGKTRRNTALTKAAPREFLCNIQHTIQSLLDQEDTTKNMTITVDDSGPKRYLLEASDGNRAWIEGNYTISTLLQELAMADINLRTIIIPEDRINEDPMSRLTRLIKTCFWKNLKRVLNKDGLKLALIDTKIKRVEYYLYVPFQDRAACTYYKGLEAVLGSEGFRVKVIKVSMDRNSLGGVYFGDTLESREVLCDTSPGLLTLSMRHFKMEEKDPQLSVRSERLGSWHNPIIQRSSAVIEGEGPCPFYVPGGRFNEMYGWDSYFIAKGLIHSGELAEAMCIAENLRYQIVSYGKILNANRSYYLFRGNPPLFSTLVDEIVEQLTSKERETHQTWIEECVDAMVKEYQYFQRGYSAELGLTKHLPGGKGVPMETEEGHFFSAVRRYVEGAEAWTEAELQQYVEKYNRGEVASLEFEQYLQHDRAVRESGHDTSKRVDGIAGSLYTVDLNSLLYKMERDILRYREVESIRTTSEKRQAAINTVLWDGTCFYDYNEDTQGLSSYRGATSLYPLFSRAADAEKVEVLLKTIQDLVGAGGIFTGSQKSCVLQKGDMQRQWDHPYGWAPHQILAWIGLSNYGEIKYARTLALKWCTMIGRIFAQYNGTVTEKYNLEKETHKVAVEYGNIGTDIQYVPREGFGWTNSSWLVAQALLKEEGRRELYARISLGKQVYSAQ